MQRRASLAPHPSYDLDGVSAKDLFWAKKFDTNKDGQLSLTER
jgi:hypothetical protein